MLKQSFSRIKKVLTISLAALFVVALTATSVSASLVTEQSVVAGTMRRRSWGFRKGRCTGK